MLGAIIGDIIGSRYEHDHHLPVEIRITETSRFTDDTVLTIATIEALFNDLNFKQAYVKHGQMYPFCGFGSMFLNWLNSEDHLPYGSYGNGAAMRISPVGLFYKTLDQVLEIAEKSASVSHNHPDGIIGAKAIAHMIYLSREGCSKEAMKDIIEKTYHYDLTSPLLEETRFDASCQHTVPLAMKAFLNSTSYEDALFKSISLKGDSDTIAAMCGGIAEAYYKTMNVHLIHDALYKLDAEQKVLLYKFYSHVKQSSYEPYITDILELLEPYFK
ncbi:MAG: ADP-ribosylglycohydrolase family protein [Clostridia bacterium]|nr:ADP-ribosylglycohydrolase family protein [Clostridia bacterium]